MKKLLIRLARYIVKHYALDVDPSIPIHYEGKKYDITVIEHNTVPNTDVSTLVIKAFSRTDMDRSNNL